MDHARLWIRDNCNSETIKSLGSTENGSKPVLYLGLGFLALVYLLQRAVASFRSKKPLRTATRSPDPEKKAPERPKGGQ